MVLACAVVSQAGYPVSRDKDRLTLQRCQKTEIIIPELCMCGELRTSSVVLDNSVLFRLRSRVLRKFGEGQRR